MVDVSDLGSLPNSQFYTEFSDRVKRASPQTPQTKVSKEAIERILRKLLENKVFGGSSEVPVSKLFADPIKVTAMRDALKTKYDEVTQNLSKMLENTWIDKKDKLEIEKSLPAIKESFNVIDEAFSALAEQYKKPGVAVGGIAKTSILQQEHDKGLAC